MGVRRQSVHVRCKSLPVSFTYLPSVGKESSFRNAIAGFFVEGDLMQKHLYDKFYNWQLNGSIWLYSDPHFNDPEMQYIRKNYIGDEEQVKRINNKVHKGDTLVILGDIGDTEFVKKLNGHKILIMGNHDSGASNYKKQDDFIKEYETLDEAILARRHHEIDYFIRQLVPYPHVDGYKYNNLFDEVYEGPLFISDKILLSHEPINLPFVFNIHGHDHSNWHNDPNFHHLNVCAEWIDYMPVNLTAIIKSGVLKHIDNIHRIIIDSATERKEKREAQNDRKS